MLMYWRRITSATKPRMRFGPNRDDEMRSDWHHVWIQRLACEDNPTGRRKMQDRKITDWIGTLAKRWDRPKGRTTFRPVLPFYQTCYFVRHFPVLYFQQRPRSHALSSNSCIFYQSPHQLLSRVVPSLAPTAARWLYNAAPLQKKIGPLAAKFVVDGRALLMNCLACQKNLTLIELTEF